MTNDTAVRVSGLRKRYGDTCAVDGVELEIGRGEVFALLGPNGAGKTTTVEILEGFRRRDGGVAEVLGQDPGRAGRAWRARIGIVLQLASAGPELTVREMVRHFAGFYPRPRDPDEVDRAGGADRAGRPADQRAVRRPGPAGGRGPRHRGAGRSWCSWTSRLPGSTRRPRRQFWELIRALAAERVTVVLTTHYLEEAAALAGRLAVLAGGRGGGDRHAAPRSAARTGRPGSAGTPRTAVGRYRPPRRPRWSRSWPGSSAARYRA